MPAVMKVPPGMYSSELFVVFGVGEIKGWGCLSHYLLGGRGLRYMGEIEHSCFQNSPFSMLLEGQVRNVAVNAAAFDG